MPNKKINRVYTLKILKFFIELNFKLEIISKLIIETRPKIKNFFSIVLSNKLLQDNTNVTINNAAAVVGSPINS